MQAVLEVISLLEDVPLTKEALGVGRTRLIKPYDRTPSKSTQIFTKSECTNYKHT